MSNENGRILIVGLLNIETSYKDNTQAPAGEIPDTVQFWLAPDAIWRIRTFATDHDIHIHNMGDLPQTSDDFTEPYIRHIAENYGDILTSVHVTIFPDYTDASDIEPQLRASELPGSLELTSEGFALYNPDEGLYETQSEPQP